MNSRQLHFWSALERFKSFSRQSSQKMFAKGIWSCAALLLVVLSCVDVSTARKIRAKRSTCVSDEHINGCSTPTGHEPYREEFTPACNEHDVCYFCGTRYSITREQCDNEFKQKMYEICDSGKRSLWSAVQNLFSGNTCKATADIYYSAVDNFGASHYEDPSPDWCENSCVQDLLDDYFSLVI